MAYALTTPPAKSKEEFRAQGQLFLEQTRPFAAAIEPLFRKNDKKSDIVQQRFDALLSVAYDIGLDSFFDSSLPKIATSRHSKHTVREAFAEVPAVDDVIRTDLAEQMRQYKMPSLTRREIEHQLFLGNPVLTIGRCKDPSGSGAIVYAPTVMHPIMQFLCRTMQ